MINSQQLADNIISELKRNKKHISEMCTDLNLNKNAISTMKSGYMPRLESLCNIADYLNVSLDVLLGRQVLPNSNQNDLRQIIVNKLLALPDDKLDRLLGYLEALASDK